jgi:hypothetical protein
MKYIDVSMTQEEIKFLLRLLAERQELEALFLRVELKDKLEKFK